eukprot:1193399-Prorocentrum_minimum.AAC.1
MEADTPETDGRGSAVDTLYGLYTKNLLFPVGEDEGAIPQWKSEDQYGRRTLDITLLYGIVATCGMAAVFWAVLQYAIYEWSAPRNDLLVTDSVLLLCLALLELHVSRCNFAVEEECALKQQIKEEMYQLKSMGLARADHAVVSNAGSSLQPVSTSSSTSSP